MKIKKFNELFNASRITSALKKDLSDSMLTNFIGDLQKKSTVSVTGEYNQKEEKFDNILDAVDYILDSFRSDSHKRNFKMVDIGKYTITNIKNVGNDYGFESAYIGLSKDSDYNFEILISDKRYIGRLKRLFYTMPALVVGKLKFK